MSEPGDVGRRLAGRVALVTGASRGIGAAIADRLACEGVTVVGLSRTAPSRVGESSGAVEHVSGDVTGADDVRRAVDLVIERHGRLDVLVNNAGVEREGTLEETAQEACAEVMDVNVGGVFLTSRYAIPHLRTTRGVIVNIA